MICDDNLLARVFPLRLLLKRSQDPQSHSTVRGDRSRPYVDSKCWLVQSFSSCCIKADRLTYLMHSFGPE